MTARPSLAKQAVAGDFPTACHTTFQERAGHVDEILGVTLVTTQGQHEACAHHCVRGVVETVHTARRPRCAKVASSQELGPRSPRAYGSGLCK